MALSPSPSTSSSSSDLLVVLPHQSHSISNSILHLYFSHPWQTLPHPLSIDLVLDASPGCGGVAWPAGQILATYLIQKGTDFVSGRNTIELGSGTGLVGLLAGILGGNVWITDQSPLLPIMRRNVSMNNLCNTVKVAELRWGSPIPPEIPRPDLILAADCVYFEPTFPLLVQTLTDLADATTEILFCYKKRRKADKRFFALLKKTFTWEEVQDDSNRSVYNREAITLLRLSKKLA
ncbi:hypothetical protein K443DRAFT_128426 [Laccaria amethystina LaAM-08-1]|uniref:Protein-lysine N-methyltransferase EFM6 n=1 Tax=Laccaria amethystina LaAM-08-1 TaxID=1095629 RepID=A0A0C9Y3R3_9AGAR|nr:hypothetical protein K443DRAFT_128426 [Laccaria amethystina LaAM-08-1]